MDFRAALTEIASWSVHERIQLVQAILDTILAEQPPLDLTEAQKEQLDARRSDLDAAPHLALTWEQVKPGRDEHGR